MEKEATVMTDFSPNDYLSILQDENNDILVDVKQITPEENRDILDKMIHFYCQGHTRNTVNAIRAHLIDAILLDQNQNPLAGDHQENSIQKYFTRCGDNCEDSKINYLSLSDYGDIQIRTQSKLGILFKSPQNGGKSPNIHKALLEVFEAMKKDSENCPQICSVEFKQKNQ